MLSLTKKSDDQPVTAPRWHTNFRNFDTLPDTKVVRTTFFINTAAIVVAVSMGLWLGFREYTNYNIRQQQADAQQQIESNSKQNAEALKLSKIFAAEEKKLNEAAAFMRVPIGLEEFIEIIGLSLPKEISIDFTEKRITGDKIEFELRGRAAGSNDQATGIANTYSNMLQSHPRLGKVFNTIELKSVERDNSGTFMFFNILLTLKAEKK